MISENLAGVMARLAAAAARSGRAPTNIRLVAVSKTVSDNQILEAVAAGVSILGESKVQEARDKIAHIGRKVQWHFIGRLQKNKVKHVFDLFDLIHSVDSSDLAREIHLGASRRGTVMPVLAQVNVSGEASKSGINPEHLEKLLTEISRFHGVRVMGLTTIPPYDPDPEKSRPHFARLRELRDRMVRLGIENISLHELSMGMSNDFAVAVEEGATLVRIGMAIFGERPGVA